MNVHRVQQERKQLFEAVYNGIIPRRVPIMANLPIEFCIQYAGLPLAETQWTLDGIEDALDKACKIVGSDYYPFGFMRFPAPLQILGSRGFVMGSNGFIQHPEVTGMEVDEYDDFIKNPYDCILEKILPRLYPELDADPVTRSLVFAKAFKAHYDYQEFFMKTEAKMVQKYGFYTAPKGSLAAVTVPFDFLADFLRGFKGISMDVRRCPQKIVEACEAVLPLQIKKGMPKRPSKYGQTFIPLHMGPYLRTSDFEKLYWPTFSKMVQIFSDAGQPCRLFCEHDWMRYLDYLQELPENTRLHFEYGDPKLVKEKLGKKHIISGFYPLTYLKTATKQQCIDKAKELIDVLAPGGKYVFAFDKSPVSLDSVDINNYIAVLEYIVQNTEYASAGELAPAVDKTVDKPAVTKEIPIFKSKYCRTWEEYKKGRPAIIAGLEHVIASKMQNYEDMLFDMISRLM